MVAIIEYFNQGYDSVDASVSDTLSAYVEKLTLLDGKAFLPHAD